MNFNQFIFIIWLFLKYPVTAEYKDKIFFFVSVYQKLNIVTVHLGDVSKDHYRIILDLFYISIIIMIVLP